MYLLPIEITHGISAASCLFPVFVSSYKIDTSGMNCDSARILASMANYDLATSGLIGYQPNGYCDSNPFYRQFMSEHPHSDDFYLFFNAVRQVVPAHLIA